MKKALLAVAGSLLAVNSMAQVGAAIASLQSGKLDAAKTQIDKAVTDDKQASKSKTWFYRGEVYKSIAGDQTGLYSKLDSNAVQVAYDSYKKAQEVEPGSTFAKQATEKQAELGSLAINAGAAKFQAQSYASAAQAFEMARQINPKDTAAALYAAYSYINMQDKTLYPKAISALQVLIDANSTNPANYLTMVDLLRAAEDDARAIEIVKKGIERFPNNKELREKEFNLNIATGKNDEARKSLEEQVKREPNNPVYLKNLGILYDQSGEKAKAQEYYEKTLAIDANDYDANFNLGVLHFNKGAEISQKVNSMDLKQYQKDGKKLEAELKQHFNKALPYFEKCYQAKQDDPSVLQPLEKIYRLLGRTADADKVAKQLQATSK